MIFRIIFAFLGLLLAPLSAAEAYPLTLGDVTVEIPVPEGYVPAAESEEKYQSIKIEQGALGNDTMAIFVPSERTHTADDYDHALEIAVLRKFRNRDCTKEELQVTRKEFNAKLGEIVDTLQNKAGLALTAQAVHEQSDRHFSFSMRLPNKEGIQGCVVCSTALIRGRMWYFVVRNAKGATPEDLIWAKETSKNWLDSIIANNPSDAATLAKENGEGLLNLSWGGALIGALAGGVVGLVAKLTKKNSRRRYAPIR